MRLVYFLPILLLTVFSCQPFKYSPTDLEYLDSNPEFNVANLTRISAQARGPRKQFKIAVLADTHIWYDELEDFVDRINADTTFDFVVLAGDFTKFGYADEYTLFTDIFTTLKAPGLAGIGNHDLQADGKTVYQRLFGPMDFSFTYRGAKFIFFNDNARGIDCCVPDFAWLENELAGAGDSLAIIAVSHAAPESDQLDSALSQRMIGLFAKYHVKLSIHGHSHNYDFGERYGDGVPYLIVDDIGDRNYAVVTWSDAGLTVERIFF